MLTFISLYKKNDFKIPRSNYCVDCYREHSAKVWSKEIQTCGGVAFWNYHSHRVPYYVKIFNPFSKIEISKFLSASFVRTAISVPNVFIAIALDYCVFFIHQFVTRVTINVQFVQRKSCRPTSEHTVPDETLLWTSQMHWLSVSNEGYFKPGHCYWTLLLDILPVGRDALCFRRRVFLALLDMLTVSAELMHGTRGLFIIRSSVHRMHLLRNYQAN